MVVPGGLPATYQPLNVQHAGNRYQMPLGVAVVDFAAVVVDFVVVDFAVLLLNLVLVLVSVFLLF